MRYRLGDICKISKNTIAPLKGTCYTLFSLPAFDNEKTPELSNGEEIKSNKFNVCSNMILFNKLNVRFKRVWNINFDLPLNCVCSTEFIPLLPIDCDQTYLYYRLIESEFTKTVESFRTGTSSSHQRISVEDLLNLEFEIPVLREQRLIAETLSCLDDKIELNTRINKNLEAQAQAIFKSWFVDFEPFQDGEFVDSELGQIPKGWAVKTLEELCKSVSITITKDKTSRVFLNTGDVSNGLFLHKNYTNVESMPGQAKKSIQFGDILYSEIRPINKHFAYVNFSASDYVVSTKLMVIRCVSENSRRIYHFLTQQRVIEELQQEAETRSGTFPQITFDNIKKIKIIIAEQKTEKQFGKILDIVFNCIDRNIEQNQTLAALRDTLLPKLMNGEIQIPQEV